MASQRYSRTRTALRQADSGGRPNRTRKSGSLRARRPRPLRLVKCFSAKVAASVAIRSEHHEGAVDLELLSYDTRQLLLMDLRCSVPPSDFRPALGRGRDQAAKYGAAERAQPQLRSQTLRERLCGRPQSRDNLRVPC